MDRRLECACRGLVGDAQEDVARSRVQSPCLLEAIPVPCDVGPSRDRSCLLASRADLAVELLGTREPVLSAFEVALGEGDLGEPELALGDPVEVSDLLVE